MTEGFCTWYGELGTSLWQRLHHAIRKWDMVFGIWDQAMLAPNPQYQIPSDFIKKSLGVLCDVGTPGLIPNPVVKDVSADGTWRATSRESRSMPRVFFYLIIYRLKYSPKICTLHSL